MPVDAVTIQQVRADADGTAGIRPRSLGPPGSLTIEPITIVGSHDLSPNYNRPTSNRYITEIDDGLVWGRTMAPLRRRDEETGLYLMQDRDLDLATGEDFAHDFAPRPGGFHLRANPGLKPDRVLRAGVLAATRHGSNYFHWLVAECLPRLLLADAAGHPHLPVIVGSMPPQHGELLDLLWPGRAIAAIDASELVQFRRLVVPKTSTYNPDTEDARNAAIDSDMARQIRQRLVPICRSHWRSRERPVLYASRSRLPGVPCTASNRRPVNELAVERALAETFGARIIHPEEMSVSEQIEAFAQASLVISPAGSTLANLIFCRAGTPTIVLGQNRFVFPEYFGMLADVVQVPLSYVACPIMEGGFAPFHHAYEVPIDVLLGHAAVLLTTLRHPVRRPLSRRLVDAGRRFGAQFRPTTGRT
jgi:hypothetical protein